MKLQDSPAPYIYTNRTTFKYELDLCMCMLLLLGVSAFFFGNRVLILAVISVLSGYISNVVSNLILFRTPKFSDISAITAALAITLLMPASAPFYIVAVANVVAVFFIKHPFGGTYQNIFNPVAGAVAFVIATYSKDMLSFPMPFSNTGLPPIDAAHSLKLGSIPNFALNDILIGLMPTPAGTGSCVLILACGFYLAIKKAVRLRYVIVTILSVAVLGFIFPRTAVPGYISAFYEVFACPTLFYVIFVLSDYVTSPTRTIGIYIYAVLSGVVIIIFRHIGIYSISEPFAVLVLNSVVPMIDNLLEGFYTMLRRRAFAKRQKRLQQEFIGAE